MEQAIDRGPEHQCGAPNEACCIPGCPECRAVVDHYSCRYTINVENAELIQHRVFNWDKLCDELGRRTRTSTTRAGKIPAKGAMQPARN